MNPLWKLREAEAVSMVGVATPPPVEGQQWPPLIGKLLAARGFTESQQVDKLLFPKLADLKDPLELKGMSQALERLGQAYLNKEKICIYADFDLDGTSGLALLKTGMLALGFPEVQHYQPKRLSEGYGFHAAVVEELKAQGVSVIITVDVGITAHAAVDKARELGIDVILTDHHLPAESIPNAYVVVNPNQGTCESALGYLCGAGVAFYLLRGLKRYFQDHPQLPKNNWDLKEVLDYFTIGTLTDMVPLVDDNRVLVKHGLVKLAETKRAGLRALLEELDLTGRPLTSQDVAIRFAPKLNALSRMESGILPVDIFLLDDPALARDMVRTVMKNNSTRVQLQGDAEIEAQEKLKDWPHKDFVFVASKSFHRGVVGLIATKLTQVFNKPAFVGSLGDDGMIVGSARLPQGQEACLVQAMGSAAELMSRFGGHSAAAGFEIAETKVPMFIDKLAEHFEELREKPKPLEVYYDIEAKLPEVSSGLMKWYDFVGPFGAGFTVPLLHFSNIEILSKRELKGGHLRLKLADPETHVSMEALLFTPTPRQIETLQAVPGFYNILGELQWNYFAGQKTIQILIRDLKAAT
ncbi:single-stranded-DNA-specific exonuclease RecJ [Bdellovibrio svalbardensis]|uniref:Single-stranded-DNA-specific exonuclease RecJ n=1 Tax=Bdellovibrio svalbardensis TaxID=2972972 RepID=A0ABT6DHL2_9BACT|nr:single-stranded-DNA-specific exonuclease RecJ [Bdellovibrio svalbardensis]MDG0816340.1 single-stranded-DNA-specific exonuclease RecJ [Bdellovibrio svalbardensis]